MQVAIAQVEATKGNIEANIKAHQAMIARAIAKKADAIFFPELSITGYEPSLAAELSLGIRDRRLAIFQAISDAKQIVIGLGVPTKSLAGIHISMLLFQPNRERKVYCKHILHTDELPYFVSGTEQVIIELGELKIAPAICYESLQTRHLENALQQGANVYLASVAKSQEGIEKAQQYFPNIAKANAIPVLMSNCTGYCDNFESAGQSAIWNAKGELVAQLSAREEGMLIYALP